MSEGMGVRRGTKNDDGPSRPKRLTVLAGEHSWIRGVALEPQDTVRRAIPSATPYGVPTQSQALCAIERPGDDIQAQP